MVRVRAHVWISGRVQGVFFRAHTKEVAEKLGLTGWVRNLPDGRVEAVFEGEEDAVKEAIEWCKRGPPLARVEKVEVRYEDPTGEFRDFRIVR
jgi:acylphosphatase